jgi:hypothetical protein
MLLSDLERRIFARGVRDWDKVMALREYIFRMDKEFPGTETHHGGTNFVRTVCGIFSGPRKPRDCATFFLKIFAHQADVLMLWLMAPMPQRVQTVSPPRPSSNFRQP